MTTSLQKTDELTKQFEQLTQIISNCNKAIEETITTTTNHLRELTDAIKHNIEEASSIAAKDLSEWEQLKTNLSKTRLNGKVKLDVGGRDFVTTVETLTHEKNTFFTALFSRQWDAEKDDKGRIFIDRNGDLFVEVLDFMRTPSEYTMPEGRLRKRLITEAKFYKLSSFLDILTEPDRKGEENRLQMFENSTHLTMEQKQKLNEFYGKPDQLWKLIYKATRDGFEGKTFHRLCDNQGPTMVIIRSTGGYVFGGYASQSWNSNGSYINAQDSFLFLLTNANGNQPTKFICKKNSYALYGDESYGPTFGNNHDLKISDCSNANNDSCCNLGGSYPNTLSLGPLTFTGENEFQITDIEVFKLP